MNKLLSEKSHLKFLSNDLNGLKSFIPKTYHCFAEYSNYCNQN